MLEKGMNTRSRFTLKHHAALDRRRAAIHEAGHVVMAQHVGIRTGGAYVFPSLTTDPICEKQWRGQCVWSGKARSKRALRMFAVAGIVAECVWDGDPCWESSQLENMSPTDWAGTGCEPDAPSRALMIDAERVFDLFDKSGPLWPKVLTTARGLIVASRDHPAVIAGIAA